MNNQKLATQYRADDKRLSLGCIAWILAILSIPAALIGNWGWSYLNSKGTALIALDASNGKYLWSSAIDNDLSRLQPLVVDSPKERLRQGDRVFVRVGTDPVDAFNDRSSYQKYRIDAFSTSSGQKLQSFTAPELTIQPNSSALDLPPLRVEHNRLWLNTTSDRQVTVFKNDGKEPNKSSTLGNIRQGKVLNIDPQTGKLIRSIDRNWSIEHLRYDGIVINDSTIAILRISPTLDIGIEGYNLATGQKLWETPVITATAKVASPLFRRYRLFANAETIFLFDTGTKQLSGYSWDTGKNSSLNSTKIAIGLKSSITRNLRINDRTIYSFNNDNTVSALDLYTGTQRWEIDPTKNSSSICPFLRSMTAQRSGIYLLCLKYGKVTEVTSTIVAIDRQTGKTIWYARYPDRMGGTWEERDLISNSKTVYGVLQNRDRGSSGWEDAVVAIANTDGKQRWKWQSNFRLYEETIAVDEERFFVLASVPRWRLLLGAID